MIDVALSVEPAEDLALTVEDGSAVLNLTLESEYIGKAEDYAGPYEVTPTSDAQVLDTQWLRMVENVIVAPIPSNYGLISWDGSSLMVS